MQTYKPAQPPQPIDADWTIHRQTVIQGSKGVEAHIDPSIPISNFDSLHVWNPWQAAWEKPKYMLNSCEAWLATRPMEEGETE